MSPEHSVFNKSPSSVYLTNLLCSLCVGVTGFIIHINMKSQHCKKTNILLVNSTYPRSLRRSGSSVSSLTAPIAASQYLHNNWERLLPSPLCCVWLCMSCLLDRDLGNMSYTVYLDMIWGQSVGFKQRGRRRLTERLHYLKWLFVFNFTFQLISSGSGHREVITDAHEPAGPERECVCVCG